MEAPPTLDLDGEVEMQGGDEKKAEHQSTIRLENQESPTTPTLSLKNEIDMQEGGAGVKRGQSEHMEKHGKGKFRRREGIKRGLRDIIPVSYEEYDSSWDQQYQSKKCKKSLNCLLASCRCKRTAVPAEPIREKSEDDVTTAGYTGSCTISLFSITPTGLSAGTTAASSTHTPVSVSQLHRKPRSIQSSGSRKIFKTMLTLMLLLASIMKVEGNLDWRESPFNI